MPARKEQEHCCTAVDKTLCSRTTFYRPFQVLVLAEGHMNFYRQVFCIARISKRKNGERHRLITSKLYMFKHSSYFLQFKIYLYEQACELLKGELFGSNHRSITLMLKKNLYWDLSYLCKEMDLITLKVFLDFSTLLLYAPNYSTGILIRAR